MTKSFLYGTSAIWYNLYWKSWIEKRIAEAVRDDFASAFCGGDKFAAKAVTSLSGFLLLHQPKVYRPGKRGEFSLGRKNKNGCSRPHVNKYINQKGRLLHKQRTARTEKSAQKEALRQDISQQDSPQQMVQRFPTDTLHSGLSSSIGKAAAVEYLKEIE